MKKPYAKAKKEVNLQNQNRRARITILLQINLRQIIGIQELLQDLPFKISC